MLAKSAPVQAIGSVDSFGVDRGGHPFLLLSWRSFGYQCYVGAAVELTECARAGRGRLGHHPDVRARRDESQTQAHETIQQVKRLDPGHSQRHAVATTSRRDRFYCMVEMVILILAVDAHFGGQIAGPEQDHVDAFDRRDRVARLDRLRRLDHHRDDGALLE